MNQLNISRNIFLDKEELTNFQSFLQNDSFSSILEQGSSSFGFVIDDNQNSCKVIAGQGTQVTIQKGAIVFENGMVLNITNNITGIDIPIFSSTSPYKYSAIQINTIDVPYEDGYVSVDVNGGVSSTSINFSGKIRGQSDNVPTYVRFCKINDDGSWTTTGVQNNGVYEVVSFSESTQGVINNFNLSSNNDFVSESNLGIIVLGTLPIGQDFTTEQLNGLYTYSRYHLTITSVLTSDYNAWVANGNVFGQGWVNGSTYIPALIAYTNGQIQIIDTRFWGYINENAVAIDSQTWVFLTASGTAGGDLEGVYPNPTIKSRAVTSSKIALGGVTQANIATPAIGTAQLFDGSVTYSKLGADARMYDLVISKNSDLSLLSTTTAISVLIKSGSYIFNGTGGSNNGIVLSSSIKKIVGLGEVQIQMNNINTGNFLFGFNQKQTCDVSGIKIIFTSLQDVEQSPYSFANIDGLTNCSANTIIYNCSHLSECRGLNGYLDCDDLDNCYGETISGNVYDNCSSLTLCEANISNPSGTVAGYNNCTIVLGCRVSIANVSGVTRYGYRGCTKVQQGLVGGFVTGGVIQSGAYNTSRASYDESSPSGQYDCADTPAGGFNSILTGTSVYYTFTPQVVSNYTRNYVNLPQSLNLSSLSSYDIPYPYDTNQIQYQINQIEISGASVGSGTYNRSQISTSVSYTVSTNPVTVAHTYEERNSDINSASIVGLYQSSVLNQDVNIWRLVTDGSVGDWNMLGGGSVEIPFSSIQPMSTIFVAEYFWKDTAGSGRIIGQDFPEGKNIYRITGLFYDSSAVNPISTSLNYTDKESDGVYGQYYDVNRYGVTLTKYIYVQYELM